jgi:hypothetical protein
MTMNVFEKIKKQNEWPESFTELQVIGKVLDEVLCFFHLSDNENYARPPQYGCVREALEILAELTKRNPENYIMTMLLSHYMRKEGYLPKD